MRGEVEPVRLTTPFAIATGAGGWLTAAVATRGDDFLVVGPVALVLFALVGAALGRGLARQPSVLALVLFAPAAGALLGAVVETLLSATPPAVGAVFGAAIAALHVPALVVILLAARAVPRVREGTWPHAAARRRVVVATAGSLGVAILGLLTSRELLASENATRHLTFELVATMALGAIGGCLLADVRDLVRMRAASAANDPARFVAREAWHDVSSAELVDFGAGDEEAVALEGRATAYRDAASVVTHLRGTADRAARVLRAAIAADAFALTLTCVFFATALAAEPGVRVAADRDDLELPAYDAGVRVIVQLDGHARPRGDELARYAEVLADDPFRDPSYTVERERDGAACVHHWEAVQDVGRVRCTHALPGRLGLTLQRGGRMALAWSFDAGLLHFEWIHLETGVLVREGRLAGADGPGAIGATGALVVPMAGGDGLAVTDLWTGASGKILSSGGRFEIDPTLPWRVSDSGTETLIASRALTDGHTFQIVAIDPRAVLR